MKFNGKFEINGEMVYTAAQFKEILEYAAMNHSIVAADLMSEESNDNSLSLAEYNLDFSNVLLSFSAELDDYLS